HEHDMTHGVRDCGALQLAMWLDHRARVSAEPALEERAFRRVLRELEGPLIRRARVLGAAERAEELAACRVIEVVPVEVFSQREELDVRLLRALDVPHGDGSIQSHDRRLLE